MVRLIGVPRYLTKWVGRFFSAGVVDILWRLALIAIGGLIVYVAITNIGGFVAAIAGIVLSIFVADDLQKLAGDIWNRRWAEVSVNLGR